MANLSFEYNGKTYNTADRTVKGQSAREYWASITGQDKSKFPGSSSSVSVTTWSLSQRTPRLTCSNIS